MEELLACEHDLFTWINSTHTPLTDALLWPFSGTLIWSPVGMVSLLKEYTANGLYGFISGHTTNAFGFAMLSSLLIGKRPYTIGIFVWALAMGYSRIYLGAHFVSDVWAGMIMGSLLGGLVFLLYRWATKRYFISHTPTEG